MNSAGPDIATRFHFEPGRALVVGRLPKSTAHAHHAVQVTLALTDALQIRVGFDEPAAVRAVIVPPNCPHLIDADHAASFYFEAESLVGRQLAAHNDDRMSIVDEATASQVSENLHTWLKAGSESALAFDVLVAGLAPQAMRDPTPLDPRVAETVDRLRKSDMQQVPVSQLARDVHLSPSRLRHLFREQVGLPIRRYVLWLRLVTAIELFTENMTLTEVAAVAGFSDSAHLTRTFRSMFGMAPSGVVSKDSQFVQASAVLIPRD